MKSDQAYTGVRLRAMRTAVQLWFILVSVWMGWDLYRFVLQFERPGSPFVDRPSGVDAFLPISGLMSLKVWLASGAIEPLHPAALIVFLAAIAVSLVFRKSFCGWICPVGTVSEWLWKGGRKLIGRNLVIAQALDVALRAIKYFIMAAFIFFTWIVMSATILLLFFMSDYYNTTDVRMLQFFMDLSATAVIVLGSLAVLSVLYKNFWCRYLCPYGALLGLAGLLSPFRISRDPDRCTGCRSCTRACPALIEVHEAAEVNSPECIGCLTCVSRCPEEGALLMSFRVGRLKRRSRALGLAFPALVVLAFYLVLALGVVTDNWHSKIAREEYQRILGPTQGSATPGNYSR